MLGNIKKPVQGRHQEGRKSLSEEDGGGYKVEQLDLWKGGKGGFPTSILGLGSESNKIQQANFSI